MKLFARTLIASLALTSSFATADDGSSIVEFLNEAMPNTTWTDARPLNSFPGYYHLSFEGRDADTQYYFDADRKVLVIGMMVNLDVGSNEATNQSIATGRNED